MDYDNQMRLSIIELIARHTMREMSAEELIASARKVEMYVTGKERGDDVLLTATELEAVAALRTQSASAQPQACQAA